MGGGLFQQSIYNLVKAKCRWQAFCSSAVWNAFGQLSGSKPQWLSPLITMEYIIRLAARLTWLYTRNSFWNSKCSELLFNDVLFSWWKSRRYNYKSLLCGRKKKKKSRETWLCLLVTKSFPHQSHFFPAMRKHEKMSASEDGLKCQQLVGWLSFLSRRPFKSNSCR